MDEVTDMWWMNWNNYDGYGPPFGGPPFWIFPLVWLVILAAVITAVVLLRRRAERRTGLASGEAVLAERFARGEIDEEEYRQRQAVLHERRH